MADGRPIVTRTTRMLGIALAASTDLGTSAFAQQGGNYGTSSTQQQSPQARSPEQQQQQQKPAKGKATLMLGNKKITLSPEFAKVYDDLVNTVNANDIAGAGPKVAAAHAAATTPEEHYLASQVELKVAMAKKDEAGMGTAVQAMLATGVAPQE